MEIRELTENKDAKEVVVNIGKKALKNEHLLTKLEGDLAKVLVSLQNNPKWNKYVTEKWASFSEEKKTKIYKEGAPTYQMMTNTALLNPAIASLVKGKEYMRAPVWRWLAQAGLVERPGGITEQQLMQDLEKDGKVFEKLLFVVQAVVAVFAPEAIPELGTAKTIILQIMNVRKGVAQQTRGMGILDQGDVAASDQAELDASGQVDLAA